MNDDCQCSVLHQDRIDRVNQGFPDLADLLRASEVFRLLGDPSRLRIVQALSIEELCVCDLAAFLGASSSAVSHQLRLLNQARVLGDLRVPPGNRLEALRADRHGQHSIRINDQWRICFMWDEGGPSHVEIVDYHV